MDKDKNEKECKKQVSIYVQVVKHPHSLSLVLQPPHDNWRNFNNSSKKLTKAHSAIFPTYIYRQAKTNNWKEIQTICAALIRGAPTVTTLFSSSPSPFLVYMLALSVFLVFRLSPLTHTRLVVRWAERARLKGDCLPLPPPSPSLALSVFVVPLTTHTHTHSLVSCTVG